MLNFFDHFADVVTFPAVEIYEILCQISTFYVK